jgi:hypothetical protein
MWTQVALAIYRGERALCPAAGSKLAAHVSDVLALTWHPVRGHQLAHDLLGTLADIW